MEWLAFVHDDHPLEKKRYFGIAIRTILPYAIYIQCSHPIFAGNKIQRNDCQGWGNKFGNNLFKHQYENVQANIPKLLYTKVYNITKS